MRGNTPHGDPQYHERAGSAECSRKYLRSFDNCSSSAGATADHLLLWAGAHFFYARGSGVLSPRFSPFVFPRPIRWVPTLHVFVQKWLPHLRNTTPFQKMCGSSGSTLLYKQCITPPHLSHPKAHVVAVRTCYHTPWFITPRRGPCELHFITGGTQDNTPPTE